VHGTVIDSGYLFSNVGIKVRFAGFETHTRSRAVKLTNSLEAIERNAKELARPFLEQDRPVRLVGVRVAGLVRHGRMRTLDEFAKP